ncbi:hypothetical protein Egran_03142 [Elaphomyces granulatus]|uniref:Uncharacterized protein n=1 Tax=Elaphomyces granulatus TaxID=519963 RepID=A0A232LYD8_9EURO|nr:hypothetical protein Egran_03142 [Elaphomyces granulatus]
MATLDERICLDKATCYRGKAKISLQKLKFERILPGVRTIHDKHVDRLVNIFREEGCSRHIPWNYVPVLISDRTLNQSLQISGLEQGDLMEDGQTHFLELPQDISLEVLHGKHRLLAAEKFLWDKWWTVELYSDDLSEEIRSHIREEYSHSRQFCDGDIYRNLSYYQRNGNVDEENKWLQRLSNSKSKYLKQLRTKLWRLNKGFDQLLPFAGLWSRLTLGCLGRLLPLKCPEELLHYLQQIYRIWHDILAGVHFALLDHKTVTLLETLVPQHSTHDAACIHQLMEQRHLFPAVQSQEHRSLILNNILKIEGRILSFETFLQDTIYFGACSTVLRRLLPPKFPGSVREAFLHCYTGANQVQGQIRIQVKENSFHQRQDTQAMNRQLAYRQLFLAAMRDFPILSNLDPLWDSRKEKPTVEGSDKERWYSLATLAFELGFETDSIKNIKELGAVTPEEKMARDLLLQLRPPERYIIDEVQINTLARYIAEHIGDIAVPRQSSREPEFTTNLDMLSKDRRCNRPPNQSYKHDREFLFIDVMFIRNIIPRSHVTSLYIQRDIFLCFFGHYLAPQDGSVSGNSSPLAPSAHIRDELSSFDLSMEFSGRSRRQEASDSRSRGISSVGCQASTDQGHAYGDAGGSLTRPEDFAYTQPERADEGFSRPVPRAYGFENDDCREMNKFYPLNRSMLSAAQTFLSTGQDEGIFVILRKDTREYAKFYSAPEEKSVFETISRSLADEGHRFILTDASSALLSVIVEFAIFTKL